MDRDDELEDSTELLSDDNSVESADEDYDFAGEPNSANVPSWLEQDPNPQDFIVGESEEFLDPDQVDQSDQLEQDLETQIPDTIDLFGSTSPDSLSEIAEIEEQRDAYLQALRQLQADFENYKKRVVRDSVEEAENRGAKILEDLLPVLDNFELAIKAIGDASEETKNLLKGIELVYLELSSALEKQGLELIDAQGAIFNPELHDAVSHEDNDEHEVEIVVEVLRPGYKVRGRVVRPAMVKVAK